MVMRLNKLYVLLFCIMLFTMLSNSACVDLSDSGTYGTAVVNVSNQYFINESISLCTDTYVIDDDSVYGSNPYSAIYINGSSVTIDGNGSTIDGSDGTGICIRLNGSTSFTLTNLTIQNFTHDIILENTSSNEISNTILTSSNGTLLINGSTTTFKYNILNQSKNINFDSSSNNNSIYENYFYNGSSYYINNSGSYNDFNLSNLGNYYEDILTYNITDSDLNGTGDTGSDYPYNSSQSKWVGNGADYYPLFANISGCGNLSYADTYVKLTKNYSTTSGCFIINETNITLDCNGYTIIGNMSGAGVLIDEFNETIIKNCIIQNFTQGIKITNNASLNDIKDNTITNCSEGILISEDSSNNTIQANELNRNTLYGLNLNTTGNNTIYNNMIYNNSNTGFNLASGISNNISYNNISQTQDLHLDSSSTGNTILHNRFLNGSSYYINNSGSDNDFNDSTWGNYYEDILYIDITDSDLDGAGDMGGDYPYNSSQSKWVGNGADYHPLDSAPACGTLLESGTYTLLANITTTTTCFIIRTDDIILDCDGHTITGDGGTYEYGVDTGSYDNVTVKNCVFIDFKTSVKMNGDYGAIINNNITGWDRDHVSYGVTLQNSNEVNITNNEINDTYYGISSVSGIGLIINNNTCYNNKFGIILTTSGSNNTISNNTINDSTAHGVYLHLENNATIENNQIINNEDDNGIYLRGTTNSTIYNNNVTNNGRGIYIFSDSIGNMINNNTITESIGEGIFFMTSDGNYMVNNTLNNSHNLLLNSQSDENSIYGNYFYNGSDYYISNSGYDNVFNNTEGGNYYEDILTYDIYDTTDSGTGDSGADYPYNSSQTYWIGSGADYMPLSPQTAGCVDLTDDTTYGTAVVNVSNQYFIDENVTLCLDTYTLPTGSIIINGSDVIFNCYGSTIDGVDDDDIGINVSGQTNVTIKNCTITNYDTAIKILDGSNNSTVINTNVSSNNMYGYYLQSSSYAEVDNIRAFSSKYGIWVDANVVNSSFHNSFIYDHSIDGFTIVAGTSDNNVYLNDIYNNSINLKITGGDTNAFYNNTLTNGSEQGIYAGTVSVVSNTIFNNSISFNGEGGTNEGGIYVTTVGNGNVISYNNIFNNTADGIGIETITNLTVEHNTIYNNVQRALRCSEINNSQLIYNTIYDNNYGVSLASESINNLINNNVINDSTQYNLYLHSSSSNNITYNNISNSQANIYLKLCNDSIISNNLVRNLTLGIELDESTGIIVKNNTVYSQVVNGILIQESSDVNVTNNTLYDNGLGLKIETSTDTIVTLNDIYENNGEGISVLTNSSDLTITYNNIYNNTDYGLDFRGSNNSVISHNNITNTNGSSINLRLINNIVENIITGVNITDNLINNSIYGIIIDNNGLDNITSTKIYKNNITYSTYGIFIDGGYGSNVTENIINEMTGSAIWLNSSFNSQIENNTLSLSITCVNLTGSSTILSTDNIIYDNYFNCSSGISLTSDTTSNIIYYNNFTNGSTSYVNNNGLLNEFNSTRLLIQTGNIYSDVLNWGIYDITGNGRGDSGADYPYNSSQSKWTGNGADYHPLTTQNYSGCVNLSNSWTYDYDGDGVNNIELSGGVYQVNSSISLCTDTYTHSGDMFNITESILTLEMNDSIFEGNGTGKLITTGDTTKGNIRNFTSQSFEFTFYMDSSESYNIANVISLNNTNYSIYTVDEDTIKNTFNNYSIYNSTKYIYGGGILGVIPSEEQTFNNFTIGYNSTIGKIKWVNFTADLIQVNNDNLLVQPDFVSMNSSSVLVTDINKEANITINTSSCDNILYVLSGFPDNATIIRDTGSEDGTATEISCSDNTAVYEVTGFSGYAMGLVTYTGCVDLTNSSTYDYDGDGIDNVVNVSGTLYITKNISVCQDTYVHSDIMVPNYIVVNVSDIDIDMNGSTINMSMLLGKGISLLDAENITIYNFTINGFFNGLYTEDIMNTNVNDATIKGTSSYAITLKQNVGSTVWGNNFSRVEVYGSNSVIDTPVSTFALNYLTNFTVGYNSTIGKVKYSSVSFNYVDYALGGLNSYAQPDFVSMNILDSGVSAFDGVSSIITINTSSCDNILYVKSGFPSSASEITSGGENCTLCSRVSCLDNISVYSVPSFSGYAMGEFVTYTGCVDLTNSSTYDYDGDGIDNVVLSSNTYYVNKTISLCEDTYLSVDSMISINASNINLDCNGSTLTGAVIGSGIVLGTFSNITVHGCTINYYSWGITGVNSNGSNIYNNTIHNVSNAVFYDNAMNNNITNNTITNCSNDCIYFSGSSEGNEIFENTITHGKYGISVFGSNLNKIYENDVFYVNLDGIQLSGANNNTIYDNNLSLNSGCGIFMTSSDYNNLTNNTANNNVLEHGIHLYGSDYNSVSNNTANANVMGIYNQGSLHNNITNNTMNTNTEYGLKLQSSNYGIISKNNMTTNTIQGINVIDSNHFTLYNNTVNQSKNIYIGGLSTNNTFYYNTFNNGSTYHINNSGSSNQFNASVGLVQKGNVYDDILTYEIYDTTSSGTGDSGADYPYNSSQSKWTGNGADYHPLTTKTYSGCVNLSDTGTYQSKVNRIDLGLGNYRYEINASVSLCQDTYTFNGDGTAISIVSYDDITLDCNGSTIEGYSRDSNTGITTSKNNITVHGCSILLFETGIYYELSIGSSVYNNTVTNITNGINIAQSSTNATVYDNIINYSTSDGILFNGSSHYGNVYNNNINGWDYGEGDVMNNGIRTEGSDSIIINENNVTKTKNGIRTDTSDNLNITDNRISTFFENGIKIYHGNGSIVSNNTVNQTSCLIEDFLNGIYVIGDCSAGDSCSGTPNACNTYEGVEPCNDQEGCEWDELLEVCSGTPNPCSTMIDEEMCSEHEGCEWGEGGLECTAGFNQLNLNTIYSYDLNMFSGIYLSQTYNDNIFNNTLEISGPNTKAIRLTSNTNNEDIYYNNYTLMTTYFVYSDTTDDTNNFNTTLLLEGRGNIYPTADIILWDMYDTDADNWADSGYSLPYNSSQTHWFGLGGDYAPYTTKTEAGYSGCVDLTNSSTWLQEGHYLVTNVGEYYSFNDGFTLCNDTYSLDVLNYAIIINFSSDTLDCNGSTFDGVDSNGIGIKITTEAELEPVLITLKNCNIKNYGTGIQLADVSTINIYDTTVYDNTNYGIDIQSITDMDINNTIIYNSSIGISSLTSSPTITNCEIYDNTDMNIKLVGSTSSPSSGCSGTPNACNTYEEEEPCTDQSGCEWTGIECKSEPWECNMMEDPISCADHEGCEWDEGEGITYDNTRANVSNNVIYNSPLGIYMKLMQNNTFNSNTFTNLSNYTLYFAGSGGYNELFNNEIYNSSGYIYYNETMSYDDSYKNLTIGYNTTIGKIEFSNSSSFNVTYAQLNNTVLRVYPDYVSMNSSSSTATQFNVSSTITVNTTSCSNVLYVLSGFPSNSSVITSSGSTCPSCTEISCSGSTAIYSVPSWSGYAMGLVTYTGCVDLTNSSTYDYDGDGIDNVVNDSGIYYVNTTISLCTDTYTSSSDMLRINASNIELDCNGSTFDGEGVGTAVNYTDVTNITLYDLNVIDYDYGFRLDNCSSSTLYNLNLTDTTHDALYLTGDSGLNTFNNTVIYGVTEYIEYFSPSTSNNTFNDLTLGYNSTVGLINWVTLSVNDSQITTSNLLLGADYVSLDGSDSGISQFNGTANITITTTSCSLGLLYKEGFPANRSVIVTNNTNADGSTQISCVGSIAVWEVAGFSGYTSGDVTSPGGGGGGGGIAFVPSSEVAGSNVTGGISGGDITDDLPCPTPIILLGLLILAIILLSRRR